MMAALAEGEGTMPTLRRANAGDRVAIERLLADAGLPGDGVAEILATRPADFVVAEDPAAPGALLGVAGLEVCCDNALLRSVAVRPEWRARGLGREIIGRAIREGEARGLRALYLLTTTAEHYFPRFGFATVAREAVPAEIRETVEFRSACPNSAVAMERVLARQG
jgi:amino-acid N-acetyltransferase